MKIIFQEEDCGYNLVFNTDWTFCKKILDLCWKEITWENFYRKIEQDTLKDLDITEFGKSQKSTTTSKKSGHNYRKKKGSR